MPEHQRRQWAESTQAASTPRPAPAQQQDSQEQAKSEAIDRFGSYVERVVAPQFKQGEDALQRIIAKHPDDPTWLEVQQLRNEAVQRSQGLIAKIHGALEGNYVDSDDDFSAIAELSLRAFQLIDGSGVSNEDKMLASQALFAFSSLRREKVRRVVGGEPQ